MTISEQFYNNAKEAQDKWTDAVKSVFDETKRAFDGETFKVDTTASGERVHQSIDQVFELWSKALDFNRDLVKKVAEANMEYLNVLRAQAEAAGEQYLAKFEEARARAEKVARETQDALAKSAIELENSANQVAARASDQLEETMHVASEQTVKMTQQATHQADKAAAEGDKNAAHASAAADQA
jgi:hypothetical protein